MKAEERNKIQFLFPSSRPTLAATWEVSDGELSVGRRLQCHFGYRILPGTVCRLMVRLCGIYYLGPEAIYKESVLLNFPGDVHLLIRVHDDGRAVDVVARGKESSKINAAVEEIKLHINRNLIDEDGIAGSWGWLCPICVQNQAYPQQPIASCWTSRFPAEGEIAHWRMMKRLAREEEEAAARNGGGDDLSDSRGRTYTECVSGQVQSRLGRGLTFEDHHTIDPDGDHIDEENEDDLREDDDEEGHDRVAFPDDDEDEFGQHHRTSGEGEDDEDLSGEAADSVNPLPPTIARKPVITYTPSIAIVEADAPVLTYPNICDQLHNLSWDVVLNGAKKVSHPFDEQQQPWMAMYDEDGGGGAARPAKRGASSSAASSDPPTKLPWIKVSLCGLVLDAEGIVQYVSKGSAADVLGGVHEGDKVLKMKGASLQEAEVTGDVEMTIERRVENRVRKTVTFVIMEILIPMILDVGKEVKMGIQPVKIISLHDRVVNEDNEVTYAAIPRYNAHISTWLKLGSKKWSTGVQMVVEKLASTAPAPPPTFPVGASPGKTDAMVAASSGAGGGAGSPTTISVAVGYHCRMEVAILTKEACYTAAANKDDSSSQRLWWSETVRCWNSMLGPDKKATCILTKVVAIRNLELQQRFERKRETLTAVENTLEKELIKNEEAALAAGASTHKKRLFSFKRGAAAAEQEKLATESKKQRHQLWVYQQYRDLLLRRYASICTDTSAVVAWFGHNEATYGNIGENGFTTLPAKADLPADVAQFPSRLHPGLFGLGYYVTQERAYMEVYRSPAPQHSVLLSYALPGRIYPVTEKAYLNANSKKETLNGKPCNEHSPCQKDSNKHPHDSHFAVIKPSCYDKYDSVDPPPSTNGPFSGELVLLDSAQILPSFIVYFDRRPRILLWLDDSSQNTHELSKIWPTASEDPDDSKLEVKLMVSLAECIDFLESRADELADYPNDCFRIIVSGRLCKDLFKFMNSDPTFKNKFPPTLVYHSWKNGDIIKAVVRESRRHNVVTGWQIATAVTFGGMSGDWAD